MDARPEAPEPASPPTHLATDEVQRVAREFTRVYHDLKDQTFATTTWLGVPLVKTATDILAFQQIIAATRPDLIVETGVYVGGSALLFASIQELCGIDGEVVAVDVDLGAVHDKVRDHPRIELIEASSVDPDTVTAIRERAGGRRVMVDLDSDHRAHHVLSELRAYADLVTPGCYLVVEDGFLGGRPVRPEAVPGPSEALEAWWAEQQPFVVDRWHERFLLTQNPRGYMRRLRPDGSDEPPRPPRPEGFLTGALELSGGPPADPPAAGRADEEFAAAAGESDREVDALRERLAAQTPTGTTVEKLLGEIAIQRDLLRERDRLLARDRARLRRITESLPYRAYRALRRVPGARKLFELRDRRRQGRDRARSARRAHARSNRSKRFIDHHRGQ